MDILDRNQVNIKRRDAAGRISAFFAIIGHHQACSAPGRVRDGLNPGPSPFSWAIMSELGNTHNRSRIKNQRASSTRLHHQITRRHCILIRSASGAGIFASLSAGRGDGEISARLLAATTPPRYATRKFVCRN